MGKVEEGRVVLVLSVALFTLLGFLSGFNWWAVLFGFCVGGPVGAGIRAGVTYPAAAAILTFCTLIGFHTGMFRLFADPESLLYLAWMTPAIEKGLRLAGYVAVFGGACLVIVVHRSFPDPLLAPPLALTALLVTADLVFFMIYPHPVGPLRLQFHTTCALAETAAVTWVLLASGHLFLERSATRRRIRSQSHS